MKKYLTYIQLVLTALAAVSCTDELKNVEEELIGQNTVTLAAHKSRIITKAGLEYSDFDPYTKYMLYSVESGDSYDWDKSTMMYDRIGEETDEHLIDYSGNDIFFGGKKLDFYGATLCSPRGLPENSNNQPPGSPVIDFRMSTYGAAFPDLMYSNNLKNCTAQMGLLEMNFTHALSKVQVVISRQNDKDLEGIKINSVSLVNCSANGSLDIVGGVWDVDEDKTEILISENELTVTETPVMMKDGNGNDAHALIIPNETSKDVISLHIHLTTSNGTSKEFTYPLYASPVMTADDLTQSEPFIFNQNHRYVLEVILLDEGVRVLAVSPQAYEWIDVPLEPYMGQPLNFGGLMWMDRNLGATSADCENDWANTRGFYYQYGRNIPYIFDYEKFINRCSTKNLYRVTDDETSHPDVGYEYFFTYDQNSNKVYGAVQGGTQTWHYFYHVSALTIDGKEVGWVNNGSGWEWQGSDLVNYSTVQTPKFRSANGAFDYGNFTRAEQVGHNGISSSEGWTASNGSPQWHGPNVTTSNIAINPGDPGIYHFIWDARYYHDWFQSGCWCVMDCTDYNPNAVDSNGNEISYWDQWRNLTIEEWDANYSGWTDGTSYPAYKGWLLNHGCRDTRTEDTDKVNYFWADKEGNPIPDNHPCPKGWRIPTKEDFASIIPDHNIENSWAETTNTMYVLQETYGDVLTQHKEAAIYGVDHLGRKVIYLIKRKGEDECYRLRLLWKDSKLTRNSCYGLSASHDPYMQYLEISRFSGNSSMTFDKYFNAEVGTVMTTNAGGTGAVDGVSITKTVRKMTGDELNNLGFLGDFDWESSTEVMQIPICGFIYPGNGQDGMFGDGTMTILRSTDWSSNYDLVKKLLPYEYDTGSDSENPNYNYPYSTDAYPYNEAMNWCMYIRTDRNTGLFSGSRKSLGDQIRCVRDVNVK